NHKVGRVPTGLHLAGSQVDRLAVHRVPPWYPSEQPGSLTTRGGRNILFTEPEIDLCEEKRSLPDLVGAMVSAPTGRGKTDRFNTVLCRIKQARAANPGDRVRVLSVVDCVADLRCHSTRNL